MLAAAGAPVLVGLAATGWQLFAALVAWGLGLGALDLGMNAAGLTVEDAAGTPVMSGLHGWWGIGALLGSGVGVAGAALHISVLVQFVVVGLVGVCGAATLTAGLLADRAAAAVDRPVLARPTRALALVALVAGADLFCEGSAGNWSAVYLHDSLHIAPAAAGLSYTGFLAALVGGRMVGDLATRTVGVVRTVRLLSLLATVAFALALLAGTAAAAYAGFVMLGLGLSGNVPAAYAAAGRLPGVGTGFGLAAVTTCGYTALVCAPPLIGGLASVTSLRVALATLPVMTAVVVASAGALARADRPALRIGGQEHLVHRRKTADDASPEPSVAARPFLDGRNG
jgi:hypothetical protein